MKKGLKIGAASLAALLVFGGVTGCGKKDKLPELPAARLAETTDGSACLSNDYSNSCSGINTHNLYQYLGRSDVKYVDLRGYKETLSAGGALKGFEHIEFFEDIYSSGATTEKQLFNKDYTPKYTYSVTLLEQIFPKDKTIFLSCASGGRVVHMMNILERYGWDMSKIYNVGGYNNYIKDANYDNYKNHIVKLSAAEVTYKEGTYTETIGTATYTANVKVVVDAQGKIENVYVVGNKEFTGTAGGEWNPETWLKAKYTFLNGLKGKTLADINTMLGANDKASGSDVVTGASLSSNRVLKAVKDALSK